MCDQLCAFSLPTRCAGAPLYLWLPPSPFEATVNTGVSAFTPGSLLPPSSSPRSWRESEMTPAKFPFCCFTATCQRHSSSSTERPTRSAVADRPAVGGTEACGRPQLLTHTHNKGWRRVPGSFVCPGLRLSGDTQAATPPQPPAPSALGGLQGLNLVYLHLEGQA